MKHHFFVAGFTLALLFSGVTAFAQIRFGVKAGGGVAGVISDLDAKMRSSFSAGGIAEFGLTDNFWIGAGLQFQNKGYRQELANLYILIAAPPSNEVNINLYYLQVPVSLSFQKSGFFAGAGPYMGMALAGNIKSEDFNGNPLKKKVSFGNSRASDYRRFDYGIKAETGYGFLNRWRVTVSYELGLANILPDPIGFSARNQVAGLSVTYFLGITPGKKR